MSISAEGTELITGGGDGRIRFWDLTTGELTSELVGGGGVVLALVQDPLQGGLVSAGLDGRIWIWEGSEQVPAEALGSHDGAVYDLAIASEARLVVSAGSDGEVLAWDLSTRRILARPIGGLPLGSEVRSLYVTQDGKGIIAGMSLGEAWSNDVIFSWDLLMRERPSLYYNTVEVSALALAPDGNVLAMATKDGLAVLDLESGAAPRYLGTVGGYTPWLSFSSDGSRLAWAGGVYDFAAGSSLALPADLEGRDCVTFRPGTNEVATCRRSGGVELSGHADSIFAGAGRVNSIVFSGDGRLMATASVQGVVRVWDVLGGGLLRTLYGPSGSLDWSMGFTPGEELLAVVGTTGDIYIWNTNTWALIVVLRPPYDKARLLTFDPQGRALVAAGATGRIYVWGVAP